MPLLQFLKIIFWPFSAIYGLITSIRNFLFDHNLLLQKQVPQKVISVGNLTLGGTGKSPFTEYLVNYLKSNFELAILSRGYGRKTKGFQWASPMSTSETIGDEPLQFFQKFYPEVVVAVSENRVLGAKKIFELHPELQIIILDDAFQHRAIHRDVNILLNDYNRPFYNDTPIPGGRLREQPNGAKRADVIIVTKCPINISAATKFKIRNKISRYCLTDTPIFFASIQYGDPRFLDFQERVILSAFIVTGIALPEPFYQEMSRKYDILGQKSFPDHHKYTEADVKAIIANLKRDTFVITTEKDIVKLKPLVKDTELFHRIAYVPIEVDLGNDKNEFDQFLLEKLNQIKPKNR